MEKRLRRFSPSIIIMAMLVVILAGVLAVTLTSKSKNDEPVQVGDASGKSITIHFKQISEDVPHIYYENVNGNQEDNMSFPGLPMMADGDGWCTYTINDAASADIIVSVPEMSYRSVVASKTAGEYWLDEGYWYDSKPELTDIYATQVEVKDTETVMTEGESAQFMSNTATSGITVHFYTTEWTNVRMYYWNTCPTDSMSAENGVALSMDSAQGDGWYSYTFSDATKANFFFFSGKEQTIDLTRTAGEWWYSKGKWYNKKPGGGNSTGYAIGGDMREDTVYFLMTTRFYDGDKGNNKHCWDNKFNTDADPEWRGDFKGLGEKLDYLKAMGFSAIWITPVVKNASGYDYHGYHAINFTEVDDRYESTDYDYQDLIDACHAKGIKVIQDIVFNHTCNFGEENLFPIFTKDDPSTTAGTLKSAFITKEGKFVGVLDKAAGGTYSDSLKPADQYNSRIRAFKNYLDETGHIYHGDIGMQWEGYTVQTAQMADDCVDLNTENPVVAKYLRDAYTDYVNMGVDGFRIDTVKHISRLTFNKEFIPQLAKAYQTHNNTDDTFYMVGEICAKYRGNVFNSAIPSISGAFYTWKETKSYSWGSDHATNLASTATHWDDNMSANGQPKSDNAFLNGVNYHTPDTSTASGMFSIDFLMHYSFVTAGEAYGAVTGQTEGYGDNAYHDSTYNLTYVDSHDYGPDNQAERRYCGGTAAWAENMCLMWTFRGIPCIYYGSEVEFKNDVPIDKGPTIALEDSGRAYFGDYLEGSVTATDFSVYTASGKVSETLNSPLSKHLQKLNQIRRAVPALQKGQYLDSRNHGNYVSGNMAYIRRYTNASEGIDSLALVTITDNATFKNIPNGKYVDCVTGDVQNVSNGTLSVSAPGKGNMRVYVLNGPGKIGSSTTYLK